MITIYHYCVTDLAFQNRKVHKFNALARKAELGLTTLSEVSIGEYVKVSTIDTDDLEAAWEATQHGETNWTESLSIEPGIDRNFVHSTSLGDVLQRGDAYFMVIGIGFKQFQPADVKVISGSAVLGGQSPASTPPRHKPGTPRGYDVVLSPIHKTNYIK